MNLIALREAITEHTCPMCGGTKRRGTTTFTCDLGHGVVVVRQVPATVCGQCHAEWLDDAVAEELEAIVADARQRQLTVEVTTLAKTG